MSTGTALLILAVIAAGSFCPAMMWIQSRRGRSAPCCPPAVEEDAPAEDLDALRRRQEALSQRIAELAAEQGPARQSQPIA